MRIMKPLRTIAGAVALLLAACASTPEPRPVVTTTAGGVSIDTRYTAQGQDSRVLFLVIHYTVADLPQSIKILTEEEVSAHYLVSDDADPVIYRLVDESRRAWHSGPSYWAGHAMLNAGSIGIEIVHPGFRQRADGSREYLPFAKAQIDALIPLMKDIVKRHQIRPERILGHAEVLPQAKEDPGPTFPWKRLADEGIVAWPDANRVAAWRAIYEAALPDVAWFQQALATHGYDVQPTGLQDETTRRVIASFQMRYRPSNFDGKPDAETAALVQVLNTPP
jgi:N-acetylmuramoyl-L-alanine amidase